MKLLNHLAKFIRWYKQSQHNLSGAAKLISWEHTMYSPYHITPNKCLSNDTRRKQHHPRIKKKQDNINTDRERERERWKRTNLEELNPSSQIQQTSLIPISQMLLHCVAETATHSYSAPLVIFCYIIKSKIHTITLSKGLPMKAYWLPTKIMTKPEFRY